ncbi:hypothetical protein SDJN03_28922, partial [Cucurbita argyrosperma subsp. sororia]
MRSIISEFQSGVEAALPYEESIANLQLSTISHRLFAIIVQFSTSSTGFLNPRNWSPSVGYPSLLIDRVFAEYSWRFEV